MLSAWERNIQASPTLVNDTLLKTQGSQDYIIMSNLCRQSVLHPHLLSAASKP